MIKDFIGNQIIIGSWLVYPGAGNRSAEYGLLLSKVVDISDKVRAIRLDPDYHNNKIDVKKIIIKNINKYAVVNPTIEVQTIFMNAVSGNLTQAEINTIGKWVHGAKQQRAFSKIN